MYTVVRIPSHFKEAEREDIERELVDLVLEQASRDAARIFANIYAVSMNPKLRYALINDPDSVRCVIIGACPQYSLKSTILKRVRWDMRQSNYAAIEWEPHL